MAFPSPSGGATFWTLMSNITATPGAVTSMYVNQAAGAGCLILTSTTTEKGLVQNLIFVPTIKISVDANGVPTFVTGVP